MLDGNVPDLAHCPNVASFHGVLGDLVARVVRNNDGVLGCNLEPLVMVSILLGLLSNSADNLDVTRRHQSRKCRDDALDLLELIAS